MYNRFKSENWIIWYLCFWHFKKSKIFFRLSRFFAFVVICLKSFAPLCIVFIKTFFLFSFLSSSLCSQYLFTSLFLFSLCFCQLFRRFCFFSKLKMVIFPHTTKLLKKIWFFCRQMLSSRKHDKEIKKSAEKNVYVLDVLFLFFIKYSKFIQNLWIQFWQNKINKHMNYSHFRVVKLMTLKFTKTNKWIKILGRLKLCQLSFLYINYFLNILAFDIKQN